MAGTIDVDAHAAVETVRRLNVPIKTAIIWRGGFVLRDDVRENAIDLNESGDFRSKS